MQSKLKRRNRKLSRFQVPQLMACGYQHRSNGHLLPPLFCEGSPFVSQPQLLRAPSRRQPLNGLLHYNHLSAQLAACLNQPLLLSNHTTCCNYNQVLPVIIPQPKIIKLAKLHPQPPLPPHPPIPHLTTSMTVDALTNKSPEFNPETRLG